MIIRSAISWCVVLVGVLSLAGAPVESRAQVSVNTVVVTFAAKERPVRNIVVTNSGTSPMYVSVQIQKIKDLASTASEVVPSEDLLVSPKNFSIAPQGQRTIRLLLKNPPSVKEEAYRVLLLPQYSEFGEDQVKAAKVQGRTLSLKVATGIGVVVYAQPKEIVTNLDVKRDDKQVVFTNTGNVHFTVSSGLACPASTTLSDEERQLVYFDKKDEVFAGKGCTRVAGARVHAGRSIEISVRPDLKLYIGKRVGSAGDFEPVDVEAVR